MLKWLKRKLQSTNPDVALTHAPALFRRMGITPSPVETSRRGLLVIQIDGLSYGRFKKALNHYQLPFLRKLLKRGRMKRHRFLSQLPTSTPAFQAGMFYGENDNIPGFQFYDKYQKQFYKMGYAECAYAVEKSFTKPGLLRDGSVLSCVYTGGAEAAMFVFSTMLAPRRWRFVLRVWDIFILSVLNLAVFFRIAGLAIWEFVLALYDSVPLMIGRGWVKRELTVIAVRVGLIIVARELVTLGAIIDLFRRVPVIYVNYLGYDEQAHTRGPDSPVARWTLRGIDRCIRRLYKAALYSDREYDVYVLSDHGQAECVPFEMIANETFAEYMQTQLTGVLVENYSPRDSGTSQILRTVEGLHRIVPGMPRVFRPAINWYANYLLRKLRGSGADVQTIESRLDVTVVSTGPMAYIYWNKFDHPLTVNELEVLHPGLLDRLVTNQAISFVSARVDEDSVLIAGNSGQVIVDAAGAREKSGALALDKSIDPEHVMQGIRRITLMSRAGDLCIWGGGAPGGNVSFSFEFGCHSGWTDDEINAFILSPVHVEFDFSSIRSHTEFYDFFNRYASPVEKPEQSSEEVRPESIAASNAT